MDSVTVAPDSAVPVIGEVFSLALMMLSPATVEMVGASGTSVSTEMSRVVADEVLPALSVTVAESVSGP